MDKKMAFQLIRKAILIKRVNIDQGNNLLLKTMSFSRVISCME